ncbi:hypothetical protein XI09_03295 [Bradyrhizobium sp. CCBAU 11386]|nr:hypothetical protein [Bradyrhizobium sp. CCBAU 11386]
MPSRLPQLIIWDCDGVLIDSERIAARVHARVLNRLGRQISAKTILKRFGGRADKDLYADLEQEFGLPLPNGYHASVQEGIAQLYRSTLKATRGIRDVLGIVRTRSKICVASNSSPEKLRLGLAVTGLDDLFLPYVFSAAQVNRGKPAPDLHLFAANELDVAPSECLVVEDSVNGVMAGVRAGMTVIGFSMHSQHRDEQARHLLAEGAVAVAHRPAELLNLIGRTK